MPEEGVREKLSRERDEINPNPSDTDDELESLRLELARTRSQMSETVYAIQGRMNPQYVREQASSQAKDTAKEAGSSLMDTIKNNPVPAALTGAGVVGLGWLIASGSGDSGSGGSRRSSGGSRQRGVDDGPYYYGSSERSYPAYYGESEYEGSSESSSRERAQEAAGQARERAGQVGGQLQDRAGQAGEQAQQQAQRAKGGFQQMLQESPLALGALAVGIGAAVGFAVPGTSKENEAMGETRDNLVERGKQSARETRERAQKVLEEGRRSAEQEAQRQDLAPE
jgi:ElaB/YqjD/DUF883 family membrane-anchored ribosome-binding protein